jgi:hypothetical protein
MGTQRVGEKARARSLPAPVEACDRKPALHQLARYLVIFLYEFC